MLFALPCYFLLLAVVDVPRSGFLMELFPVSYYGRDFMGVCVSRCPVVGESRAGQGLICLTSLRGSCWGLSSLEMK